MDLTVLTDDELIRLGKMVNGGTFGMDHARLTKQGKADFIRQNATRNGVSDPAVEAMAKAILNAREGGGENTHDIAAEGNADPNREKDADEAEDAPETGDRAVAPAPGGQGDGKSSGQVGVVQIAMPGLDEIIEAKVRMIVDEQTDEKYGTKEDREKGKAAVKQILTEMTSQLGHMAEQVKLAQEQTGEVAPRIEIQFPNVPKISTENKHPIYPKLMALLCLPPEIRQPVALVGPAGSGKTTIFRQAAEELQIRYGGMSCSADMTSGALFGWVLPIGDGRYVPSELVDMFEGPGIWVADEYDAAPPEISVGLNAPLANGGMHAPLRAFAGLPVYIERDPNLRFGACLNTFGVGPTALYVARQQQDAASMDRWLILYMDDAPSLWSSISGKAYKPQRPWVPQQYTDEQLKVSLSVAHDFLWNVKKRTEATGIKRVISVRSMLRARACLTAGFTWEETKEVLLAGWKADEKAQVTT